MQAIIKAYDEHNDQFTLECEAVEFNVAAKHVPLIETESEPLDAIGRAVTVEKTIKGIFTKAQKEQMQKQADMVQVYDALYVELLQALQNREQKKHSKDTVDVIKHFKGWERAVKLGMMKYPELVIQTIIDRQSCEASGTDEYIGVKVNEKIIKIFSAMGAGLVKGHADKYTISVVRNLLNLGKLSNHNARRALCKKLGAVDIMKDEDRIKVYHNCNDTTASSQMTSSKEAMRHLDMINSKKRAKDNEITVKDNPHACAFFDLFLQFV